MNKWRDQIADYKKILSFGTDSNGKTKTGKLKTDYEKRIMDARIKEKLEREKRLLYELNTSKETKHFGRSMFS